MEKVSLVDLVGKVLDSESGKVVFSDKNNIEIRGVVDTSPVSIKLSVYIPDHVVDFMMAGLVGSVSCNVFFCQARVYYTSNMKVDTVRCIAKIISAFLENKQKENDAATYESFEKVIGGSFIG